MQAQITTKDFFGTEAAFARMFPNEDSCVEYLFHLRWPGGFECPTCGRFFSDILPARSLVCPNCGGHTSLTSGTVMHGTKKTISQWLLAIWWVCINESGSSARDLQRLLHLSSYQTAWTWMQKLRMVMAASDQEICSGVVEMGLGTVNPARSGRYGAEVLAAAESMSFAGITGRIRMRIINDADNRFSRKAVSTFIHKYIRPESSVVTPEGIEYEAVDESDCIRIIHSSKVNPERIDALINSFEIWLNTVHRGGVQLKHLQLYLDEFCFRANSAMLPDAKAVFRSLLLGGIGRKSMPYRELTRT